MSLVLHPELVKFGMNGNARGLATSRSTSQTSGSSSTVAAPASSPAPSFTTTECKKRQLYNPGTATWTDAPDDPAAPAYRRGQLYNPGTATWTDVGAPVSPADAPDDPAAPGEPDFGMILQVRLWEALAGQAPPSRPAPAPAPEPEPEDSGLKFANAAPAAELLAPVFVALQVASYADTCVPGAPYCTARGLRTVSRRCMHQRHRAACSRDVKHGTYAGHVPASAMPYVPRTVWCTTGGEPLP
eukprot:scaffold74313_cov51-Phaeocystis_antarctica.AAC.1